MNYHIWEGWKILKVLSTVIDLSHMGQERNMGFLLCTQFVHPSYMLSGPREWPWITFIVPLWAELCQDSIYYLASICAHCNRTITVFQFSTYECELGPSIQQCSMCLHTFFLVPNEPGKSLRVSLVKVGHILIIYACHRLPRSFFLRTWLLDSMNFMSLNLFNSRNWANIMTFYFSGCPWPPIHLSLICYYCKD
jgi:hypothetical protein